MIVEEILRQCDEQISIMGEVAHISLIMPGKWGMTNERKLCKGGPIGEIVSDNFNGTGIIVLFDAKEVKEFIKERVIS